MNILKKKKLNCGLAYQFLGIKFFLLKKKKAREYYSMYVR